MSAMAPPNASCATHVDGREILLKAKHWPVLQTGIKMAPSKGRPKASDQRDAPMVTDVAKTSTIRTLSVGPNGLWAP